MTSIEKQDSKISENSADKIETDPAIKPEMNYDTILIWESILFSNKSYESKLVQQTMSELETGEINK